MINPDQPAGPPAAAPRPVTAGAGRVRLGALLQTLEGSATSLPIYDTRGNIHGMIKAAGGTLAAAYDEAQ
ncbi:MAG: hypothetical protein EXS42_01720 [Lacunisphaera sp.]|nr:hypothetical protein [Lacunisphaera sp.]